MGLLSFALPAIGGIAGAIFGGPAGAAAGASIGGALGGAAASQSAANIQSDAANNATNLQRDMWNRTQQNVQPYITQGQNALSSIGNQSDYFNHQFNGQDLQNGLAPNYDFMLGQGLRQVGNAAGTAGSRLGGNSLAGLNRYAQDYAGNAYQNAFNNYNTQRSDIFNRLSSIAGLGENAAVSAGNTGAQAGSNIANTMIGGANAQAAGQVGVANAINNGIDSYMGWNYLNNRRNRGDGQAAPTYLGSSGWTPANYSLTGP